MRLFPLPGDRLGQILSQWWSSRDTTDTGVVNVHRLELQVPIGNDRGGWIVAGHMYRPGLRRRVPVLIEMWPALADWTRVTMDPQANVAATEQWFRDGHLSLERFVAQLNAAS